MDVNIQIGSNPQNPGPFPAKLKQSDLTLILKRGLQSDGVISLILILNFLLISIVAEFCIGLSIKNFHLMVDSLHNFLNVLALAFSLVSTVLSKLPNNQRFTYGYSRLEIISTFANCCFLVFLSLFLVFRGIHDVLESLHEGGHDHETSFQRYDLLLTFNWMRLAINLFGCLAFRQFYNIEPTSYSSTFGVFERLCKMINGKKYKKYEDLPQVNSDAFSPKGARSSHHINFHSVYVHFLIGTIVAGTFISIHSIEFLHETNFEVVFAVILLGVTLTKTKPIFLLVSDILLQALPTTQEEEISKLLERIEHVEGVAGINSARYWALNPSYLVIYLDLSLDTFSNKMLVESLIKEILQESFAEILIQVKPPKKGVSP